ncbi:pyridine nucleotide-disulfide oxidoreductase, partial [Myxococcota bacterium]|nr:pyridine nucleotide-disulfide oxidoreductase [Myxococcota bacterium]
MLNFFQFPLMTGTFVDAITPEEGWFRLSLTNDRRGLFELATRTLVLATGCRERTARQIHIHGTRPAGIYTAELAQYFINIQGYLPCRRAVIL